MILYKKFGYDLYILLFAMLLMANKMATAQKINYLEADFLVGKVISNYPTFPVVNNAATLLRLRAGKSLTGYKPWHRYYNYPEMGINIVTGSLGDKNVFGHIIGVTPEMIFNQQINQKFSISEGAGLGLSYFTKKYDEATNPTNIAIGSHVTAFGSASFMLNYHYNKTLCFSLSANVLHSSNSHIALPNLGANVPALGVGVKYSFHPVELKNDTMPKPLYDKKIHFNIKVGLGLNKQGSSIAPVNGPTYPIYITSIFISKKVSYINKLQAGFEGYFNTGVYDYIISENVYDKDQKQKSYAAYIFIGHEFLFGHFSLPTIIGGYVYNPFYKSQYQLYYKNDYKAKIKNAIVMKLGFQYYLFNTHIINKNQFYIGTYVKTNFGQADFWENAVGFQF
ncbi:MAG: acyloxyacyl hydrolase [Bacteroidia bacterium]